MMIHDYWHDLGEDDYPQNGETVIATDGDGMVLTTYRGGDWETECTIKRCKCAYEWWFRLPKLPTEEAECPFMLGSIVYLIVRRRASVLENKHFEYVKETIVTEHNFWRVYTEWGESAFATRSEAERRLESIDR